MSLCSMFAIAPLTHGQLSALQSAILEGCLAPHINLRETLIAANKAHPQIIEPLEREIDCARTAARAVLEAKPLEMTEEAQRTNEARAILWRYCQQKAEAGPTLVGLCRLFMPEFSK